MELFTLFFTSLMGAFSGAMMPGPLLTVTITESSHRGMIAGPMLIIGHGLLEIVLIVALYFGLATILKHDTFFLITAFVGSAIMILMAWGMFRSLPTLSISMKTEGTRKNNLLMTGALMSLANPYGIIWWATIGLGYTIYAQKFGIIGIILFFIGHITGDFIWYSAISTAVSKGRKLFTDKVYRILIGVCALFLLAFSVYLLFMAFAKL